MKKILFILSLIVSIATSQNPGEIGYCHSPETIEDCYTMWIWSEYTIYSLGYGDCVQVPSNLCDYYWPNVLEMDYDGWIMYIQDTYECCCQNALAAGEYYYEGSPCESITSLSLEENQLKINNLFYDLFGRSFKDQPKGFSFKDGLKYYKF